MVAKFKTIVLDAEKMLIAEQREGVASRLSPGTSGVVDFDSRPCEASEGNCGEAARFPPRPFMGPVLIMIFRNIPPAESV